MTSKEQRIYMEGMAFAYKIAKEQGLDALENEMKFRGVQNIPLNVNKAQLVAIAREWGKKELHIVAVASAATMVDDLKLPPGMCKEYLRYFNNRVSTYRDEPDSLEKDAENLNRNIGLNLICAQYMEE